MIKFTVIPKLFGTWQFGKIDVFVNFIIQKFARLKSKQFTQFFWWGVKSERIESIYFAENSGLTEKEVLLPFTQLGKEDTIIILLSA